jgi:hypothetical protein
MKDLFPGYYPLSKDEFDELWKNCVFILDTNSILNLYRYNDETRTDFIDVLRKIENWALLNQGMKKISLISRSFVNTGFYDWHI